MSCKHPSLHSVKALTDLWIHSAGILWAVAMCRMKSSSTFVAYFSPVIFYFKSWFLTYWPLTFLYTNVNIKCTELCTCGFVFSLTFNCHASMINHLHTFTFSKIPGYRIHCSNIELTINWAGMLSYYSSFWLVIQAWSLYGKQCSTFSPVDWLLSSVVPAPPGSPVPGRSEWQDC